MIIVVTTDEPRMPLARRAEEILQRRETAGKLTIYNSQVIEIAGALHGHGTDAATFSTGTANFLLRMLKRWAT